MEKWELEQKLESLVRENWDRDRLDSFEVWQVLRLLNEEFVFNLMKMREVLIDYHRGEQQGQVQYGWVYKTSAVNDDMQTLCNLVREVILESFLQLRTLKDSDVWEAMRNLERRWMVDELNDMTKALESYKSARLNDPILYSQSEILGVLDE